MSSAIEATETLPASGSTRRLKIVFVTQFALPKICGIATIVDQVARALTRQGHEVVHFSSDWGRAGERNDRDLPYRLVTVPARNPLEPGLGIPYVVFQPGMPRSLREILKGADILHAHGFLYRSSWSALGMARHAGIPAVLTEHVAYVPYRNPIVNLVETVAIETVGRATLRRADALVTYNDTVERAMRRLAPGVALVQIGNGVDFARYHPPSAEEKRGLRAALGWDERPRVLFVGRLVDKKGAPIAMEAARLAGGAYELVLAGPGAPPPASPGIRYMGSLGQDAVARLYRAADAFVLPSIGEGFPLVVQEAMATGLPVVLSDDPAYRTKLADAGSGVRLVQRTPAAVHQALIEVLGASAAAAGQDALRFARENFSWDEAAAKHVALYQTLLSSKRSSGHVGS